MGRLTCHQLGGACDLIFEADTFEEISKLSQEHGKNMFELNDELHIDAMNEMMNLMNSGEFENWKLERIREFDAS